jgi:hypothetical protein
MYVIVITTTINNIFSPIVISMLIPMSNRWRLIGRSAWSNRSSLSAALKLLSR